MPGSLAGVLVLIALVPGYLFLRLTSRHRRANHAPSQVEEVLALVAIGFAIAGPVAAIVALVATNTVVDLASTPVAKVTSTQMRTAIWMGIAVLSASVVVTLLAAWVYRRSLPIRSGDSGWHDAFSGSKSIFVEVALLDGRTVRGFLYSYDGVSHGAGRDLVLKPPIDTFRDGEPARALQLSRLILSETQVHSIAVHEL